jgi:hypothetical protein
MYDHHCFRLSRRRETRDPSRMGAVVVIHLSAQVDEVEIWEEEQVNAGLIGIESHSILIKLCLVVVSQGMHCESVLVV